MSLALINHSLDLKRLLDEGYEVGLPKGYLLINHVPYVNNKRQVAYGTLISPLDLSGDSTVRPTDHVALWAGDHPCDSKGSPLVNLVINSNVKKIQDGLEATHSFSQKPDGGYQDYYQKMTRYVEILEGEAHVLDSSATAKTFSPLRLNEEESVFCYLENSSSRAGITDINDKLKIGRIAIIGLGGTGSYILDLVAKTQVEEIHLFDGDSFFQHNAFRSPGAPSYEDLAKRPTKVAWFTETYSRMRRKIVPHPQYISEENVTELKPMNFVFLCLDKGEPKRIIVSYLIENKIPFIDVGMGLYKENEALAGSVRVTTCTESFYDHITNRVPFSSGEDNEYSHNIQIAELNALNAALAVVKWKKMCGFYIDFDQEHHTVYQVSTNEVTNEEFVNESKENQT